MSKKHKSMPADWTYDELYLLQKEIDTLLDRAGKEDEALWQDQVKNRIRGIAVDIGLYADFLHEYSESCRRNNLVLTVRQQAD